MFRALLKSVVGCGCALAMAATAQATVVDLTFEGLQDEEQILNFYNGGLGGAGSGPGPNYGITFGTDSLALISKYNGGSGNFTNEPSPDTIAFFLSGPGVVMNVPAGFDTGFSFFYAANGVGSVSVYDGLDGTGNLLGILNLTSNYGANNCQNDPNNPLGLGYCQWDPIGVSFAGIAKSVNFSGGANFVAFDDVTLGSANPIPAPEPTTIALLGLGLAGLTAARRRRMCA